jgi:hypothetical protein
MGKQEILPEDVEMWMRRNPDLKAVNVTETDLEFIKSREFSREQIMTSYGLVPTESEAHFQQRVINLLQDNGWLVCEFRKARIKKGGVDVYRTPFGADGVGFPDLVAVKPPRVLFIEDKSDVGKAPPDQVRWLLVLGKCPAVEVFVLTPGKFEEFKEKVLCLTE